MTTVTLTLLGAGVILFLSGLQCKTILQTYKDLLDGKQIEMTGACQGEGTTADTTGPTFAGGVGSDKNFGGGSGGNIGPLPARPKPAPAAPPTSFSPRPYPTSNFGGGSGGNF